MKGDPGTIYKDDLISRLSIIDINIDEEEICITGDCDGLFGDHWFTAYMDMEGKVSNIGLEG